MRGIEATHIIIRARSWRGNPIRPGLSRVIESGQECRILIRVSWFPWSAVAGLSRQDGLVRLTKMPVALIFCGQLIRAAVQYDIMSVQLQHNIVYSIARVKWFLNYFCRFSVFGVFGGSGCNSCWSGIKGLSSLRSCNLRLLRAIFFGNL